MYENELCHHGIKGMKWGVRRYQNYDGSYTKAGLKRFHDSLDKYEQTNARYKDAKNSYKKAKKSSNGTDGAKTELVNARMARQKAKNKLNKDYNHLKQDKLGDQGKELYSKGKRILYNAKVTDTLAKVGGLSISAAAYNYKTGNINRILNNVVGNGFGNRNVTNILAGAGVAATAVAGTKKAIDYNQDRKLRAYYSHTSNY